MTNSAEHQVTVIRGAEIHVVTAQHGDNLRRTLLKAGLSPYAPLTRRLNCGGRGLCATCGVWLADAPKPDHWHDWAAERFGYPRLSCQINIERSMTVYLIPEKWIWGNRRKPAGLNS